MAKCILLKTFFWDASSMILFYYYIFWDTLYKSVPNTTFEVIHCNYKWEVMTSNLPPVPALSITSSVITYQAGNDLHQNVMTSRETELSKYFKTTLHFPPTMPSWKFLYYKIEHKQLHVLTEYTDKRGNTIANSYWHQIIYSTTWKKISVSSKARQLSPWRQTS